MEVRRLNPITRARTSPASTPSRSDLSLLPPPHNPMPAPTRLLAPTCPPAHQNLPTSVNDPATTGAWRGQLLHVASNCSRRLPELLHAPV
jgi:hypothetical protein